MKKEITELSFDEKNEAAYSNHVRIGYNAFEFVFDFGQAYEGEDDEMYHTRIIMNPLSVKELLTVLLGSMKSYQDKYEVTTD